MGVDDLWKPKPDGGESVDVGDLYAPWEAKVDSVASFLDFVGTVNANIPDAKYAWRGQGNAVWPLNSSLYRRELQAARDAGDPPPDEAALYGAEDAILVDAHRWGLHVAEGSRLPILDQLAFLQHYKTPTRLLDITFNPLFGLWFAVEAAKHDCDGRVFAIDISKRLINEKDALRGWERAFQRPWSPNNGGHPDWQSECYAWRPPVLHERLRAQHGAFLLGGVPASNTADGTPLQWPRSTRRNDWLAHDEVRTLLSVPLRINKYNARRGRKPLQPLYTARVEKDSKAKIREELQRVWGIEHSTMFPDIGGFADFGEHMR